MFIGCMANGAVTLAKILEHERKAIMEPTRDRPDGFGVGFYQRGEVLHKKRPCEPGEVFTWADVVGDIATDCAVIHLRHATVGNFRVENMHPFRMRQWLFAHTGTIRCFEAVREPVLSSMPDFLRRNVRGQTDSEALFHKVLANLHERGQLDAMDVPDEVVVDCIRSALWFMDDLVTDCGGATSPMNAVLTNGRSMYAVHRGLPLSYIERIEAPEALLGGSETRFFKALQEIPVRYVLVASDDVASEAGYQPVQESTILTVRRDLSVTFHSIARP
jgi:predicted glutamine amidotransferase